MNGDAGARPLMVVGHKNPDTDSICSAIVYARFKSELLAQPAVAYRAGNLNDQTHFVLDRFGFASPPLLTDVYPKVTDIMIDGDALITVDPDDCLDTAHRLILEKRFTFLPVTTSDRRVVGKVTALRLADLPRAIAGISTGAPTSFDVEHFMSISSARQISSQNPPSRFAGRVLRWPAIPEGTEGKNAEPAVVVVDGRQSLDAAVKWISDRGLPTELVVLCSGRPGRQEGSAAEATGTPGLPVVEVDADLVEVFTWMCLSGPVKSFLDPPGPTFEPYALVHGIQREVNKYNEGGFLVVDPEGRLCGVITRMSFLNQTRFRVALVDHNEFSQAVDGMEHAEVVEVIDHHRIGTRTTDAPITFINKVVGSTCTIIAEMYRNAGQNPDASSAGLMLSALLSDTVILRSPTTTDLDREIAAWLAALANIEIDSFGEEMFSAGSALASKEPAEVVARDQKFYEESGRRFSVSQIEVVGFKAFEEVRNGLHEALGRFVSESKCDFGCLMVTDITNETTLLLCAGDESIIRRISYPHAGEATYEMKGVLSRKKQVVPYIVDLLRTI